MKWLNVLFSLGKWVYIYLTLGMKYINGKPNSIYNFNLFKITYSLDMVF